MFKSDYSTLLGNVKDISLEVKMETNEGAKPLGQVKLTIFEDENDAETVGDMVLALQGHGWGTTAGYYSGESHAYKGPLVPDPGQVHGISWVPTSKEVEVPVLVVGVDNLLTGEVGDEIIYLKGKDEVILTDVKDYLSNEGRTVVTTIDELLSELDKRVT